MTGEELEELVNLGLSEFRGVPPIDEDGGYAGGRMTFGPGQLMSIVLDSYVDGTRIKGRHRADKAVVFVDLSTNLITTSRHLSYMEDMLALNPGDVGLIGIFVGRVHAEVWDEDGPPSPGTINYLGYRLLSQIQENEQRGSSQRYADRFDTFCGVMAEYVGEDCSMNGAAFLFPPWVLDD